MSGFWPVWGRRSEIIQVVAKRKAGFPDPSTRIRVFYPHLFPNISLFRFGLLG